MIIGNISVEFTCFFWQNCKNNSCDIASEGFTCERCEGDNGISYSTNTIYSNTTVLSLDYYRSSAVCTECLVVPVSILVAVLFILVTLYGLIRKHVSMSQLTQVLYIVTIYFTAIFLIKNVYTIYSSYILYCYIPYEEYVHYI